MRSPMPKDLSEEAVAAFMREVCCLNVQRIPAAELRAWEQSSGKEGWRIVAAHVLALVREKVREAVDATKDATDPYCECDNSGTGGPIHLRFDATDAIVARVMGTDEGRPAREEAPRG